MIRRAATMALAMVSIALAPARAAAEEERITKARAAIERILEDEGDIAAEVERAEAELRVAREAAAGAERDRLEADERLAGIEEASLGARREVERLEEALSRRLAIRYRLLRRGEGAAWLFEGGQARMARRKKALDRVLQGDLMAMRLAGEAADELARLRGERERAVAEAASLAAFAQAQVKAAALAAEGREELLASLRRERRLQQRLIDSWSRAQTRLGDEVERLGREAPAASSGFGALRGSLPLPVRGAVVEVLFGRVLNARFQTEVQQNGLDLRAPKGSRVDAVGPGIVAFAAWFRAYGNLVILDHGDGYHSLYGHLDSIEVPEGAQVAAGEMVGEVGDTGSIKGAYLYFELRRSGKPVDPLPWFERH